MTGAARLAELRTFVVSLPLRRPHRWVGLDSAVGAGYVVTRLTLEDGTVGWGKRSRSRPGVATMRRATARRRRRSSR